MIRNALCAAVLVGLAACASPEISRDGIRPGVGQDFDFSQSTLRNGQRIAYQVVDMSNPLRMTFASTVRRLGPDRFRHTAEARLSYPGQNLEEFAGLIGLELPENGPKLRGDSIVLPLRADTDRRGRATFIRDLAGFTRYEPHDCFAVIGTCRYKETIDTGETRFVIVETTEEGGIWSAEFRLDPRRTAGGRSDLLRISVFSVAEDAQIIDERSVSFEDEDRSEFFYQRTR